MTGRILWRSAALLVLVLVLQLELFSEVRLFGVMPELMLGLSVAAGWQGGPERGAILGFIAGGLYDVFLPTPLALNAITYAAVAYTVGIIAEPIALGAERIIRRLFGLAGVAVGLVTFVVLGELLGEANLYNDDFRRILLVASLYTALLMPLLHIGARWAVGGEDPRAVGSVRLLK